MWEIESKGEDKRLVNSELVCFANKPMESYPMAKIKTSKENLS